MCGWNPRILNVTAGCANSNHEREMLKYAVRSTIICTFWALPQNCEKRLLASSCLSVCPFVQPQKTTRSPLEAFLWNFIFENFSKICQKYQISLKFSEHNGYFTWRPMYIYDYISMKFDIWEFFENLSKQNKISLNSTSITGTLCEDLSTFTTVSHRILLRIRHVPDKCTENHNTFC